MGWKSTVDITRADAYNMIALYLSTALYVDSIVISCNNK